METHRTVCHGNARSQCGFLQRRRFVAGLSASSSIAAASKLNSTFPSSLSTSLAVSGGETMSGRRTGALGQSAQVTPSRQHAASALISQTALTSQSGTHNPSGLLGQSGALSRTGLSAQSALHSQPGVVAASAVPSQTVMLAGAAVPSHSELAAQSSALQPTLFGGHSSLAPQSVAVSQPALLRTHITHQPPLLTAHISRPLTSAASVAADAIFPERLGAGGLTSLPPTGEEQLAVVLPPSALRPPPAAGRRAEGEGEQFPKVNRNIFRR